MVLTLSLCHVRIRAESTGGREKALARWHVRMIAITPYMDRVFSVPSLSENIVQIREYFPDFPEIFPRISQENLFKIHHLVALWQDMVRKTRTSDF